MSIKGFHLIFITVAALFCIGMGIWALFFEGRDTAILVKVSGGVSAAVGISLLFYGVYFYRKAKNIII